MKYAFLLNLIFLSLSLSANYNRILCFDIKNSTVDTLEIIDFDPELIQELTNFYVGDFENDYTCLEQLPPIENVYPESNYTLKKRASIDYDITKYPIRTSVKLYRTAGDSIRSLCSGSIISRRHVLTARHCVAVVNTDSIKTDSILVCPIVDNGELNPYFDCSWVRRIYFFKYLDARESDMAVLEMEEPVGEKTGWISVGFNENDAELSDGIFYKFSYPAIAFPEIDSNKYNGDTLYYSYGQLSYLNENDLLVKNGRGIPGESGSSIIKVINGELYASYGVLSTSNNLNHNRITDVGFYGIKTIIQNDLIVDTVPMTRNDFISVYPNPTKGIVQIDYLSRVNTMHTKVYDSMGNLLLRRNNLMQELDLSTLAPGLYFIVFETENNRITKKIVRCGD